MKPRHIFLALLLAFSHANQIVSPPLSPRPSLSHPPLLRVRRKDPLNLPKLTPKSEIFGGPEKGDFSFVSFVTFVT